MYGKVEYNELGLPLCEICGEAHHRLLRHVWLRHKISARDYKKMHGLPLKKGICSKETADKMREMIKSNFDSIVKANLLEKGAKHRFDKGNPGRTKDKIPPAEMERLKTLYTHKKVSSRFNLDELLGTERLSKLKSGNA